MTSILARSGRAVLDRFLRSRVLIAFDFDGTLAPVVLDRDSARMRRRTRALLDGVCRLHPCAVISGRRRADVLARLEGLPLRHVVGNHGAEPDEVPRNPTPELAAVRAHVEASLRDIPGVELEDKIHSLALHYRRARDRRQTRLAIERTLADVQGPFRVVPGKLVLDVLPVDAPHKGAALARLIEADAVDAAIYLGDDATDEDVFRLSDRERLLSIRIGHHRLSAAPYYIRDQRDLDVLLTYVIQAGAGAAQPDMPVSQVNGARRRPSL